MPVFTGILAFQPHDDGASLSLPVVTAADRSVFGTFTPDLPITLNTDSFALTQVDALSARFTFRSGDDDVAHLRAATGWPYLQFEAETDVELELGAPAEALDGQADAVRVAGPLADYLVVGEGVEPGTSITLRAGEVVHVAGLPEAASAGDIGQLVDGAVRLEGTDTSYGTDASSSWTTYTLVGEGETLFGARDHQDFGSPTGVVYETSSGPVVLHAGREFTTSTDAVEVTDRLDLSGLTDDQREELAAMVEADAAASVFDGGDTYNFGKQVYRGSTLYRLALDLGLDEVAESLAAEIDAALGEWSENECEEGAVRCFAYDEVLGSVMGLAPAYGTEMANDHHFHYGYFLHALGVMGMEDPGFAERHANLGALLAAEIAAPASSERFPQRRSFDDWAGHSWASGVAPFADGNNQESTSEAVAAWAGLALWADSVGDVEAAEQARWMLSFEVRTAYDYWLDPVWMPEGLDVPMFAMVWDGKRDYATWFSDDPGAMIGIQVIPAPPTMTYLLDDAELASHLVEVAYADRPVEEVTLGDWVLMLEAAYDRDGALETALALPEERIDPALSRSYLVAFILAG
ncbi:MAG TPA: hypothetical protein GX743_07540 [Actinomycetales bacterium]|nr:hypothetical protein [Actinomycetales bacterium]